MANAVTGARMVLLFVVLWFCYWPDPRVVQWCAPALLGVILLDALDGWVARQRHETSQFGAIFDIVGDRVVEVACWIVFADLKLIPVWVPLMVVARAFLVDGLRSASFADGMTPFGEHNMMRSKLTTWLTAGRTMRAIFGGAKALAFVFLALERAYLLPGGPGTLLGRAYGWSVVYWLGWVLVWGAVALTVVRALPVIFDAVAYLREKRDATVIKS